MAQHHGRLQRRTPPRVGLRRLHVLPLVARRGQEAGRAHDRPRAARQQRRLLARRAVARLRLLRRFSAALGTPRPRARSPIASVAFPPLLRRGPLALHAPGACNVWRIEDPSVQEARSCRGDTCGLLHDMGPKVPKSVSRVCCSPTAGARCQEAPLACRRHSLAPSECREPTRPNRLDAALAVGLPQSRRRACHRRRPVGGDGV